ncbi:hypothetical protein FA09DRAFT_135602 [Tilletiopsis washingtonensis]|uniref:Uncharacterized protein n=1 Tax=Tilletiopsis washingtonensis TaxID=58919 RepID=A0A316Z1I1_9BASI|nr:hypothetical protein FA09DRAFT_135602 [Tilletiopsis washingtonensis]PWN95640.1 hypothetical protein FA09DRAFT_135602 [Tilletiopsis washingtonensis]
MDGEPRTSPRPAPAGAAAPPADADAHARSKPDAGADATSSKHADRPHDSHNSAPPSPPDARSASALQSRRPEPDAGLRLPPLRSIDIGAVASSSSSSHRTALAGPGQLPPFSPRPQGPHGSAPPPLPSPSLSTHSRSELRSPPRLGTAGSTRQGPSSSYFATGPSPAASHRSAAGPSASTVSRWTEERKRPNLGHAPSDAEVYRQQQPQGQAVRSRTPSSFSDPARSSPPMRPRGVEESKTWPPGTPADAARSSLDDSRALPTARSAQVDAARSAPSAHQLESTLERLEQVYTLAGDLQSFASAHLKSRQMPSFASLDAMAMRGSDVAAIMGRLAGEANEAQVRAEAPSHRYGALRRRRRAVLCAHPSSPCLCSWTAVRTRRATACLVGSPRRTERL